MVGNRTEPLIKVGLISNANRVRLTLTGGFETSVGEPLPEGDYTASITDEGVRLEGLATLESQTLRLTPTDFDACRFTLLDVVIGIDFHWERNESQSFQGALELTQNESGLLAINELPIESYLTSVISSEMSASCPPALLRAHAIVSRSWLLAQLDKKNAPNGAKSNPDVGDEEIIRWYDRESHTQFDVCADDHCQRYQGITKAFSPEVFQAIEATRGKVLVSGEEICDARYSKSCGGMTEVYRAAWEEKEVTYLAAVYDGAEEPEGYALPLTVEANAESWITSLPPAYCDTRSPELLARILPGFDQETRDFYRWEVIYSQEELSDLIRLRLGIDIGQVRALEALERGESGRIIRLRITGERRSLIIGKELEIRRALSRSHLYSSAFVVRAEIDPATGSPVRFRLLGAGWGHGVGLCQIGAAVMADHGRSHEEILAHYFRNADLRALY